MAHFSVKQFTIYPPGGALAPAGWKKRHSDSVNKIKYTKKKRNIQTTAVYSVVNNPQALSSHSITGPAVIVVRTPAQHHEFVISVNEDEYIYCNSSRLDINKHSQNSHLSSFTKLPFPTSTDSSFWTPVNHPVIVPHNQ